MVSDGGVAGTHPPSTLHFFVGDECVLIGVSRAHVCADTAARRVGCAGSVKWSTEIPIPPRAGFDRYRTGPKSRHQIWDEPSRGTPRTRRRTPRRVMATRRARDAFDKAEQERQVAEQREVLRQRAAQRAKDRADERRHGGLQPKNTRDKRAVDGATNARANLPLGPQRTGASWGLPAHGPGRGRRARQPQVGGGDIRAQQAVERVAMEDQLAKRARRSAMARRPRPGLRRLSPVSARDGEDVPRAAPAARGGGRSVDFKRVSGPDPATDPAEYDDDCRAMLTAEEEALGRGPR